MGQYFYLITLYVSSERGLNMRIILIAGIVLAAISLAILIFIRQRRYLYYKMLASMLEQAYEEEQLNYRIVRPKVFDAPLDGFNFIFCKRYRRYVEQQFIHFKRSQNNP